MKKVLSLVLAIMLVLTLSACQPKAEEPATMDVGATETTQAPVAETGIETTIKNLVATMPEHSYKIPQKDFIDKVKNGDDMVIIDLRSAEDYAAGHIKGAVHVPFGPAVAESLAKVPAGKEVFIYCYTGQTAGQAVVAYNAAGINARSVNLGFKLGISKVSGYEDVIDTAPTEFAGQGGTIDAAVQEAVTTYFAGLADLKDTPFASYKISEDALKEMIDKNDDSIFILSVRSAEDYALAHIPGAINMPFGKTMLDDLSPLPKDKKIVVYCYTGQTAGQATAELRYLGYDAVSLNGGMGTGANAPSGWTNKGYPTVSDSAVINGVNDYFANMPDHTYKIDNKEFVALVQAGTEAMIIDLRSAEDYAKGHVKGAINVPFGPAVAENLSKMVGNAEVYTYCYTGQTAGQAVVTMNIAGIPARSVHLGFNLGISKVEGFDSVITTDASVFGDAAGAVDPQIQEAVTAYYAGLAEVKGTDYQTYKIAEDILKAKVDAAEDIYILSVRKAEDYAKGHIAGAVNVPFGKDMIKNLGSTPKDKKVVVYCYTGQTAGQAVAGMRLLGYDAVSLNGGMGTAANAPSGWANKGYPVVQ